jgi:hypothetical protein
LSSHTQDQTQDHTQKNTGHISYQASQGAPSLSGPSLTKLSLLTNSLTCSLTCFVTLSAFCVLTTPSYAEPPTKAPSTSTSPKSSQPQGATVSAKLKARTQKARVKAQSELPSGGGKVIEFKALSVEGTVQRPSAAYLLQRRKLKFRGLEPKKSFLSEVIKSVKRPPF